MAENDRPQPSEEIRKFSELQPPFAERHSREVVVVRSPVEIYEVLEPDLEAFLDKGSSTGTSLTLWTSCLSVCCTTAIALATVTMPPFQMAAWGAVTVGSGLGGLGWFLHWLRHRNSLKEAVANIKRRNSPGRTSPQNSSISQ